jgi:arabinose-5-phosphate isomerase
MIRKNILELSKLISYEEEINQFLDDIAVSTLNGRLILTGVGKNALIAEMIYEFLLPFNIDCHVLDPHRAAHGNLGLLRDGDTIVLSSKSGNTEELIWLLRMIEKKGMKDLKFFLITSNPKGKLCYANNIQSLIIPVSFENSLFNHSPQNTVMSYLIIFMGLVTVMARKQEMNERDYLLNHQSGEIGKSL